MCVNQYQCRSIKSVTSRIFLVAVEPSANSETDGVGQRIFVILYVDYFISSVCQTVEDLYSIVAF